MKRLFDIAVSSIALIVLSPLIVLVSLLIVLKLGRPVFFRQVRPGLDGKPFQMVKFRSMSDKRSAEGELLSDEARLGKFGQFLRSSSLDELPELWNVLKGEMSLVGPRPLLMQYLPLYSPHQARRHEVRPGITGLAQVKGRNSLSWPEKFDLDVWYVDHRSIWLDIRILALTVAKVWRREGIAQHGHVTMSFFEGSGEDR